MNLRLKISIVTGINREMGTAFSIALVNKTDPDTITNWVDETFNHE